MEIMGVGQSNSTDLYRSLLDGAELYYVPKNFSKKTLDIYTAKKKIALDGKRGNGVYKVK